MAACCDLVKFKNTVTGQLPSFRMVYHAFVSGRPCEIGCAGFCGCSFGDSQDIGGKILLYT